MANFVGWSPQTAASKQILISHHIAERVLVIIGTKAAGIHVTATCKRHRHHRRVEVARELVVQSHDVMLHLYHFVPLPEQLYHFLRTSIHHVVCTHVEDLCPAA